MTNFLGTTILCVKRENYVVIGGDGQVSVGNTILKKNVEKVKYLFKNSVIAVFAGSTADSLTLFEKFEEKLELYSGNISRASVELGRYWRSDKNLKRLEALLIVADTHKIYLLSGNGDVLEPDGDIIAIGSGGQYAHASALALLKYTKLSAKDIVYRSLSIAADICVYTNCNITIKELKSNLSDTYVK